MRILKVQQSCSRGITEKSGSTAGQGLGDDLVTVHNKFVVIALPGLLRQRVEPKH